jgi:hypothetical protein
MRGGYISVLAPSSVFGSPFTGFLFSSLFVVTKSNQKRPDKKNLLRLRLRADSFLSQWKGLLALRGVVSGLEPVFLHRALPCAEI